MYGGEVSLFDGEASGSLISFDDGAAQLDVEGQT